MNSQSVWVVSVFAVLLLFGNATAKTLFFDDFEGNAEFEWLDMPMLTVDVWNRL